MALDQLGQRDCVGPLASGTELFSWYVQSFGSYNRVYGELGRRLVSHLDLALLVIMLLGAEINSELENRDSRQQLAETREP